MNEVSRAPSLRRESRLADWPCLLVIWASLSLTPVLNLTGVISTPNSWTVLFQDRGVTSFVADGINSGRRLYSEMAYPYGPLPIYGYAGLVRLIGNTQVTSTCYHWALELVFATILFYALRRVGGPLGAAAIIAFALPRFGLMPYHPVERCLLAALILLWEPPSARTAGRSLAVGVLLGLWQWTKFGGAVYAFGAMLVVDVLALAASSAERRAARRWLRATFLVGCTAATLEAARWCWALATLPPPVAWDFIWPSYTVKLYGSLTERYPTWHGLKHFFFRYLLPTSGLLGSLIALAMILRRVARMDHGATRHLGVYQALFFFLLGIGSYLGHIFNYMMYYWCLTVGLAPWLARRSTLAWVAFFLVCLPANWIYYRETLRAPPGNFVLPTGDRIYCERQYVEAHDAILAMVVRHGKAPGSALVLPTGSGFYFQHRLTPPSRHTWLVPHYFRPYDIEPFSKQADKIGLIAVTGIGKLPDDFTLVSFLDSIFGPKITSQLAGRVTEEMRINESCRIYSLKIPAGE